MIAMHWTLALPEIVLSVAGMVILLVGALMKGRDTFQLCTMLTLGAFVVAAMLVIAGTDGIGYNGQFAQDAFAGFVKLLVLVGSTLALIGSFDYNEHENLRRFEFPVLVLFATVGMMLMASAGNLMSLYVGLELQSLSIYVLAAFARDQLRSSEAGLKYFVLGALASGLLLYGISLVYGYSGSMEFHRLATELANPANTSAGVVVGIVFIVAGLAFKVSAVPFHMWTPDVYEGAPTPVTLLMSTAPKVAAMALLVRAMATPFGHLLVEWQQLIVLVAICSVLLGSLGAIGQRSIKRLMAYSSIGHVGYMLIGLAADNADGVRGVLIYLVTYVFMSAGSFGVILAMRRRGVMLEQISDLSGLARRDPYLAFWMAIFMFSMAGIPPLSGFWGKYFIFTAAVDAGLWTLAVIGVLTSVIGAYYYIRIVKVMYMDAPEAPFDPRPTSLSMLSAVSGLFTALFFVFPAPIVGAAETAAKVLFG